MPDDTDLRGFVDAYVAENTPGPEAVDAAYDAVLVRAAAGSATAGKAAMLLKVTTGAAVLAGGLWLARLATTPAPEPAPTVEAATVAAPTAVPEPEPEREPEVAADAADETPPASPSKKTPRPGRTPVAAPPAPDAADTLRAELELMRSARQALRTRQLERALTLLEEHGRRFPNGRLAQEREASRTTTLCELGRGEGCEAQP